MQCSPTLHTVYKAENNQVVEMDLESLFRSLDTPRQAEGVTVRELSDRMGRSTKWVLERLRRLKDAGQVELVRGEELDITGRRNVTYRYKFKEVAE
jgi:DNA-binding Lrp family transcriptional regulator